MKSIEGSLEVNQQEDQETDSEATEVELQTSLKTTELFVALLGKQLRLKEIELIDVKKQLQEKKLCSRSS